MTYCCGILVREGLVMIADTRTNAGLDNVSTFRKLHVFRNDGERAIMLATAGNLSITQNVVAQIAQGLENPQTGELERITTAPSLFAGAELVGRAMRRVRDVHGEALERAKVSIDSTLLLGGQVAGERPRLFMVYGAGNFIEATQDTPYLQIGEHKYGKPVLDRAVSYETSLEDALKLALISMDSTMRSNLGVGMPIDIGVMRRDALTLEADRRIDNVDPYFHDLRDRLRAAHLAIPSPPYFKKG
jgi:putative proteasome-type protease